MLNINLGGTKKWRSVDPNVRKNWNIIDIQKPEDGTHFSRYDLNSKKPFPVLPNSVDNYYTSHTLEHVHLSLVPFVIGEMYKTLKPGGRIRIVVPDVEKAVKKYIEGDDKWLNDCGGKPRHITYYPKTTLGLLTKWFYSTAADDIRSGHNTVFDTNTLYWYLKEAGFHHIELSSFEKGSAVFGGLDLPVHYPYSFYMEALK
jgi:predicted SAM-dependent methyltransferase